MISFGNESNEPIFLSIVMSCLNKKLLFPTIFSQISFDLADQAETDTSPLLAIQGGGRNSLKKTLIQEVLGHSWEALAALQGREKGKAEWRRSWKKSFAKLRRVKSTPVNMASRSRTLQNLQMSGRLSRKLVPRCSS